MFTTLQEASEALILAAKDLEANPPGSHGYESAYNLYNSVLAARKELATRANS